MTIECIYNGWKITANSPRVNSFCEFFARCELNLHVRISLFSARANELSEVLIAIPTRLVIARELRAVVCILSSGLVIVSDSRPISAAS